MEIYEKELTLTADYAAMHYHHGHYGNRRISSLEDFTDLYNEEADVINYPTNTIEITKDMTQSPVALRMAQS